LLLALRVSGTDPEQAARNGPRWRRYLIAAALLLLAALGIRYVLEGGDRGAGGGAQGGTAQGICYEPIFMRLEDEVMRWEGCLACLEKQANEGSVKVATLAVSVCSLEEALGGTTHDMDLRALASAKERADTDVFLKSAGRRLAVLRALIRTKAESIEETVEWRCLTVNLTEVETVLLQDNGQSPPDVFQRRRLDRWLDQLKRSAADLAASDLLTSAESELLLNEVERRREHIPYGRASTLPGSPIRRLQPDLVRIDAQYLARQLPVLRKAAEEAKNTPAAWRLIRPILEGTASALSAPGALSKRTAAEQQQTRDTVRSVKEALAKVEARFPTPK